MMNLDIIRPLKKDSFKIAWLEVNTDKGNFIIQPNHEATILILTPNSHATFCLSNGKQESVTVEQGIAEITKTDITLLLNN